MRFQTKLLTGYLLFIIILVGVLGFIYYANSVRALEKNAYNNLEVLVDKMTQQLDSLIRPMDFISVNLLSDNNFLSSMQTLAILDRQKAENQIFINEAYRRINSALFNYIIGRDYYSVNMFNLAGDFFSSSIDKDGRKIVQRKKIIANIPWTGIVSKNNGRIVIIPPYYDPWVDKKVKVFGVVRTVRGIGFNIGYIEVQQLYEKLEKLFHVEENSHISVVAFTRENNILYSSGVEDQVLFDFYRDLASRGNCKPTSILVPDSSYEKIITD